MLLIKGFQVGLHRAVQQGFLHALNRALQRQQAVNAGRRIDLPDFQPSRLCSVFLSSSAVTMPACANFSSIGFPVLGSFDNSPVIFSLLLRTG